jgi:hypothetical protein
MSFSLDGAFEEGQDGGKGKEGQLVLCLLYKKLEAQSLDTRRL